MKIFAIIGAILIAVGFAVVALMQVGWIASFLVITAICVALFTMYSLYKYAFNKSNAKLRTYTSLIATILVCCLFFGGLFVTGIGYVIPDENRYDGTLTCEYCGGTGKTNVFECAFCNGRGFEYINRKPYPTVSAAGILLAASGAVLFCAMAVMEESIPPVYSFSVSRDDLSAKFMVSAGHWKYGLVNKRWVEKPSSAGNWGVKCSVSYTGLKQVVKSHYYVIPCDDKDIPLANVTHLSCGQFPAAADKKYNISWNDVWANMNVHHVKVYKVKFEYADGSAQTF